MTQIFGAFEHRLPGAPFFLGAALALVSLLIAARAAPLPEGSPSESA